MADDSDDDADFFEIDANDDEELLKALSTPTRYQTQQVLDQYRRVLVRLVKQQKVMAKQIARHEQIERDRKVYGKLVVGAAAFLIPLFGAIGTWFAGWWGHR